MTTLGTSQLAIYSVLVLPVLYCLYRHGRTGLLGWVYLAIFCIVRLTAGGLQLVDEGNGLSTKSSVLIVDNIGLSPLLLTAIGVLHES
jgi:prolipoprotein diacylglyceryltransferase